MEKTSTLSEHATRALCSHLELKSWSKKSVLTLWLCKRVKIGGRVHAYWSMSTHKKRWVNIKTNWAPTLIDMKTTSTLLSDNGSRMQGFWSMLLCLETFSNSEVTLDPRFPAWRLSTLVKLLRKLALISNSSEQSLTQELKRELLTRLEWMQLPILPEDSSGEKASGLLNVTPTAIRLHLLAQLPLLRSALTST